jgi:hypothetical protein
MANQVRPSGRPGPPWLLPVVLVVIVAAVILGVLFGKRIKDAFSSPTPTPIVKRVVITPTPGPSTATATPGGSGPTATPGGAGPTPTSNAAIQPSATSAPNGQGVVTPLPGTTPIPTVSGLWLGLIAHPQHEVASIQAAADRGDPHYQFYLNPVQAAQTNLPHYGFTQGFQVVSPAAQPTPTPYTSQDGRPVVKIVISYQGKTYTAVVGQPATRGPKGIWLILSIVPGKA